MQWNISLRIPLYYGQFTWSLRDWDTYKAYFSKTDTSIIRTLISVPLVSVIKRFDCLCAFWNTRKLKELVNRSPSQQSPPPPPSKAPTPDYARNFKSSCEKESLKKIQAWTAFQPMTLAIPLHYSTNWGGKPAGSWSYCEFANINIVEVKRWKYEIHIFEVRMKQFVKSERVNIVPFNSVK